MSIAEQHPRDDAHARSAHQHSAHTIEPDAATHPLDPLTAAEISAARAVLQAESRLTPTTRFASVLPVEPGKDVVAGFTPGDPFDRSPLLVLLDVATGASAEAVVSVTTHTAVSWTPLNTTEHPYGQPQYLFEEYERAAEIAKASPQWQAAMARRSLTNTEHAFCAPLAPGFFVRDDEVGRRVIRVEDDGDVPVPAEHGNYGADDVGPARTSLKPIEITQPEGPSFRVDGAAVEWENWKFRVGFNAREGLVLNQVTFRDGDEDRSVCGIPSARPIFRARKTGRSCRSTTPDSCSSRTASSTGIRRSTCLMAGHILPLPRPATDAAAAARAATAATEISDTTTTTTQPGSSMTDTAVNLSDTSTWLPLDGLAPGFDANKAELSGDLDGRTIVVADSRGTRISHSFNAGTVTWDYSPGTDDGTAASTGVDDYEAILVDDGLYYVQFHHTSLPNEAVSLVLDLTSGRALSVISIIGDAAPGKTAVQQIFVPAVVAEADGRAVETTGTEPAPTTALIGRRVAWVYSTEHAYEHVYLSPQWYTWQCLAGPERGLADTDENSAWEIRPGIYVFTWREKVIPCGSVTIADHRNVQSIRSHGFLFGLDETGQTPVHFTFGAFGRLVSTTLHPEQYDPALVR